MAESSTNQTPKKDRGEEKNPVRIKKFPTWKEESEQPTADDDMLTDNFDTGPEPCLDIKCSMISILPVEYDQVTKIEKS